MKETTTRDNGFQKPYNWQQITSWIIYTLEAIITTICFIPPLSDRLKIIFGSILACLYIFVFLAAYGAMKIDPSDQNVRKQQKTKIQDMALKYYCKICCTRVGEKTKHCGRCNRCVEVFDHHCNWFNNCIGKKNYRFFLASIWSTFLLAAFKISIGGLLIYSYFAKNDEFLAEMSKIVVSDQLARGMIALVIISLSFNLMGWIFFLELIRFHIWLGCHKITTYEYIIQRRSRKKAANYHASSLEEGQSGNTMVSKSSANLDSMEANKNSKSKIIVPFDEIIDSAKDRLYVSQINLEQNQSSRMQALESKTSDSHRFGNAQFKKINFCDAIPKTITEKSMEGISACDESIKVCDETNQIGAKKKNFASRENSRLQNLSMNVNEQSKANINDEDEDKSVSRINQLVSTIEGMKDVIKFKNPLVKTVFNEPHDSEESDIENYIITSVQANKRNETGPACQEIVCKDEESIERAEIQGITTEKSQPVKANKDSESTTFQKELVRSSDLDYIPQEYNERLAKGEYASVTQIQMNKTSKSFEHESSIISDEISDRFTGIKNYNNSDISKGIFVKNVLGTFQGDA